MAEHRSRCRHPLHRSVFARTNASLLNPSIAEEKKRRKNSGLIGFCRTRVISCRRLSVCSGEQAVRQWRQGHQESSFLGLPPCRPLTHGLATAMTPDRRRGRSRTLSAIRPTASRRDFGDRARFLISLVGSSPSCRRCSGRCETRGDLSRTRQLVIALAA